MTPVLPELRLATTSKAVMARKGDRGSPCIPRESELIADAMRGNIEACHGIYMLHSASVAGTIYSVVRNRHDTEEILQDTMVKAFSRMCDFRGTGTLEGWLKRIAINEALMFLRRRNRLTVLDNASIQRIQENDPSSRQPSDVYAKDLQDNLTTAIATLPGELRETFVLGAIEQRPYRDVAEMLGISIELVKVRVHRARHILKSELKEYLT